MKRHELSDEQWEGLSRRLPAQRPHTGRPGLDHRQVMNGILWVLKTGAPWRDLPGRYGKWQTVYSRFRRWQQAGVWERALSAVQQDADAQGEMDWTLHFVDGTVVRAHQHAAGAKGGSIARPSASAGAGSAASSTFALSGRASR
jgi:transposase